MYRLVADSFLKHSYAVAILGYRTYPDGLLQEQLDDVEGGFRAIQKAYPLLARPPRQHDYAGVCIMGHSSGAHVALMAMIEQAKKRLFTNDGTTNRPIRFDGCVGISGVYDINHHFDYEAARGVEELSPMKPVNGMTPDQFRDNSPVHRLKQVLQQKEGKSKEEGRLDGLIPPIALVHGMEDTTVPFTSTADAARGFRACGLSSVDEIYIGKLGHQEAVLQLMMGGPTRERVVQWLLQQKEKGQNKTAVHVQSRL